VLAAAEADFEPEFGGAGFEGGAGVLDGVEAQARERLGQEELLAGPKRLPPLPAVEPVGRGLNGGRGQVSGRRRTSGRRRGRSSPR
jgi:hypothetical protein